MINFIVNALKIIFLLGFLIFIHEGGHFCVAKLCKIKVKEFAIGFGKIIWQKQGRETKYTLRLIPLGGFCSMEGEDEESDDDRAFSKASVWKRMAIVLAGPIVNIVFGLVVYYILVASIWIQFANPADDTVINRLTYSGKATGEFIIAILDSVKTLFTGGTSVDQMVGIVGISEIVVKTAGIANYINLMALISISLGITNLLPIPALDGGKILILIIEIIRRKQMKIETEAKIQMIGFSILLALSFSNFLYCFIIILFLELYTTIEVTIASTNIVVVKAINDIPFWLLVSFRFLFLFFICNTLSFIEFL